jgi:hypothetical protein
VKQILSIEMTKDGVKDSGISSIAAPKVRGMEQIEGSLKELLSDETPASKNWIKVVLTDKEIPPNVFDTLKNKFEHLLDLHIRATTDGIASRSQDGVLLQNLTPEEVTKRFVARVTDESVSSELATAIDECCADIRLSLSQVNK